MSSGYVNETLLFYVGHLAFCQFSGGGDTIIALGAERYFPYLTAACVILPTTMVIPGKDGLNGTNGVSSVTYYETKTNVRYSFETNKLTVFLETEVAFPYQKRDVGNAIVNT